MVISLSERVFKYSAAFACHLSLVFSLFQLDYRLLVAGEQWLFQVIYCGHSYSASWGVSGTWKISYGSNPHSYEHFLRSSENKAWKKFRPVQDLNPWPLQYKFWLFFRPYFHYYLSSVHNCEDCFHFRFCNCSSHIWFLYLYSHWEYNLLFKKILICIPSLNYLIFLVWISTTFKLYNCSDEKGYLKFIFIFRTLLKLGSLLWSRNIPLLVCRSYGFIGCMRIVLQEHCGKNHNIFFCGIMLHLYLWD